MTDHSTPPPDRPGQTQSVLDRPPPRWLIVVAVMLVIVAVFLLLQGGIGPLLTGPGARCLQKSELGRDLGAERLIVVAAFDNQGRSDPSIQIRRVLSDSLTLQARLRVELTCEAPLDGEAARLLGQQAGAAMVVWGSRDADATLVQVELLEPVTPLKEGSTISLPLLLPDVLELSLAANPNRELPYLSGMLDGQVALLDFDASRAEVAYDTALMALPEGTSAQEQARLDHNAALAYLGLGNTRLLLANDAEGAVDAYEHAARFDNFLSDAYFNRGVAHYSLGNAGAQSDFEQVIALDSANAAAHNGRGASRLQAGDVEAALADFEQAIALDANLVAAHNNHGAALLMAGQPQAAIVDFTQALTLDGLNVPALRNRGDAYRALDDNRRAIADYQVALNVDPDYYAAYLNRAHAYFALGEYSLAIEDYNRALAGSPDDLNIFIMRGEAHLRAGQFISAISDYTVVLAQQPENAEAMLGRAVANMGNRNFAAAEADFSAALLLDAEIAEAYVNRGLVRQLYLKEFAAALDDYRKAINLGYDGADLYWRRAELRHYDLRDPVAALADYREALERDPLLEAALRGYALALYESGDYEQAEIEWRLAIDLNPTEGLHYAGLALAGEALGDRDTALLIFAQALTLDIAIGQSDYLQREWRWPEAALLVAADLTQAVYAALAAEEGQ